jgi:hypothetical protein
MWMVPLAVLAQESCPTIVQSALKAVDQACLATGRNQACYGNIQLIAESQTGVSDLAFKQRGDIADVAKIKTITLSALNAQTDEWGVALMKLQANLSDTLPGQNVTLLLFGDVEITDARASEPPPVLLDVTAASNANMRGGPSTSATVVGALKKGQALKADGRNEAADWLRIQLEGGKVGWVATRLVTVSGDVNTLPVTEASDMQAVAAASHFGPMQSFYFKSGVGDAPCAEAPDSGILIQTPEGAGEIKLSVNGVDVALASTGYFQAQPAGEMTISLIEGQGRITSQNVTRTVPAGSRVRVPLDANLTASGPPSEPEPYNNADLAALPVSHMPRAVEVAAALTQAELDALSATTLPLSGEWRYTNGTATLEGNCAEGTTIAAQPPQDGQVITLNGAFALGDLGEFQPLWDYFIENAEFTNPEPGLFVRESTKDITLGRLEVRVLSPTRIEGTLVIGDARGGDYNCTIKLPFTMVAVSGAQSEAPSATTLPVSGDWFYESPSASLSGTCDPSVPDTPPRSRVITLNVTDKFSAEDVLRAETPGFSFPDNAVYENPEPGLYTADWTLDTGDVFHTEMRFTSPTQAEGTSSLTWDDMGGRCTFATTFTLKAQ